MRSKKSLAHGVSRGFGRAKRHEAPEGRNKPPLADTLIGATQ